MPIAPAIEEVDAYSAVVACRETGATYRQLDYWDRQGIVEPSLVHARGSGSQRWYSRHDVALIAVVLRLSRMGCRGGALRRAAGQLRMELRRTRGRWAVVCADGGAVVVDRPEDVAALTEFGGCWVVALP